MEKRRVQQLSGNPISENGLRDASHRYILILGNLQSGKTSIFRHLSGHRSLDIDIPKTSVSLSRKALTGRDALTTFLIDTPGTATLFPQGEEEWMARDVLFFLKPDSLLVVADATNLRRSLALLAHAAEFQIPTVLAVNMEDEAWRRGISIDFGLLESQLGIDVVPTVAPQKLGMRKLLEKLKSPRIPRRLVAMPPNLASVLEDLSAALQGLPLDTRGVGLSLMTRDPNAARLITEALGEPVLTRAEALVTEAVNTVDIPPEVHITDALYSVAGRLADQVISQRQVRGRVMDEIGRLSHHPIWGLLIAGVVVWGMYFFVGELGATLVVDWINSAIFEKWVMPTIEQWTRALPVPLLRDALIDPDFGIVSTGLFLAIGLVMPVLFFFYFAFNILVASGYLARLSILLDRVFRLIGLNGRGILPLAMGFSCVTMALITTRMLETKKERRIASFLLLLGTPCAPLLAAMLVVLGPMPATAAITVFGVIATQTLVAGALANRIFPDRISDFIMEIPPMRVPRIRRIVRQTWVQTIGFMKEALPLFLLASTVMFAIDRMGGLDLLERASRPLVHGLLGLPDASVQVFIKTIIRRETGAAELNLVRAQFDNLQLVVTLLVMTFLTPCANAIIVLIKERGLKESVILIGTVSAYAIAVGAALNGVCRLLGISFS
ncbi:MAG: ferrous iron transporter B [Myxococcota bacterium]|nr:ferrous iron transporter B [Myxococcota bacterium]